MVLCSYINICRIPKWPVLFGWRRATIIIVKYMYLRIVLHYFLNQFWLKSRSQSLLNWKVWNVIITGLLIRTGRRWFFFHCFIVQNQTNFIIGKIYNVINGNNSLNEFNSPFHSKFIIESPESCNYCILVYFSHQFSTCIWFN